MPGPDAQGGIHYILDTTKFPVIGEVSFACSTSEYLWQVPAGITSITAVCIGGGGGGRAGNNQTPGVGGGGGGLRWINSMPVVPGEILRVKAGVGGTGNHTLVVDQLGWDASWGRPGQTSYIASDNNASVPGRTGIGGTIIVFAQGGGQDFYVTDSIRIDSRNGVTQFNEATMTKQDARQITSGSQGGTGSAFGTFAWGTIGGGNGGNGGVQGGVGGGQDGGGGGAGGWFGNGGNGGTAGSQESQDGQGGGGGGGMWGGGGGADSGGGGGGVGVFWGVGPNGKKAYYYYDGGTIIDGGAGSLSSGNTGGGGQGGSFGADGRATGTEVVADTAYFVSGAFFGDPLINENHKNLSNGNGLRGFNGSVDNEFSVPEVRPNGGLYGGGGGAAQTSGQAGTETPFAGNGGCGHVRILFVARNQFIVREYGGQRLSTQQKTINGQTVTVNYYDFNPNASITQNRNNGWPVWTNPQLTGPGKYYNLLVNWGDTFGLIPPNTLPHLPAAVGISTTQYP